MKSVNSALELKIPMRFDRDSQAKGWPLFEAQRHLMPGGNGTLTKVPRLFPDEPALMARGSGCRLWDVDGNEYIDFRCALGPVTLGYCYPEIDDAIRSQLSRGIVFGQPNELEFQLAEELIEVVPCAESVRFLKTGGEAVAATVKLARAFTGRNMLLGSGYHGWINGVENTSGILPGVVDNYRSFHYGDLSEVEALLEQHKGRVAAVLLAGAYAAMKPEDLFPRRLRELTKRHGVLLIIDEIVTGMRLRVGGYHEYYDFLPDLAVFSKGMANGMPISAFMGRRDIMDLAASSAVVSSTFSGEMLSISAALALLDVYRKKNVIAHLWKAGERMGAGLEEIFRRHGLPVELKGLAPCRALAFRAGSAAENLRLQRSVFRSLFRKGVYMNIICYVNHSHQPADIDEALERIDSACGTMQWEENGTPLAPLPAIGAVANMGT